MTIQQTIQKSIEGRYISAYKDVFVEQKQSGDWYFFPKDENLKALFHCSIHQLLLDPQFWQALGKALGWGDICINCHNSVSSCCEEKYNKDWKYYWHKFIDHLADGKDIESFFKTLT